MSSLYARLLAVALYFNTISFVFLFFFLPLAAHIHSLGRHFMSLLISQSNTTNSKFCFYSVFCFKMQRLYQYFMSAVYIDKGNI